MGAIATQNPINHHEHHKSDPNLEIKYPGQVMNFLEPGASLEKQSQEV